MRTLLIAFLFLTLTPLFCESNALFEKYTKLQVFSVQNFDFDNSFEIQKCVFGSKLSLPFLNADLFYKDKNFTYGANFFKDNYFTKNSAALKIGMLSFGGGYSKLNSPNLSTSVNGLSTSISSISPVSASLPSSGSSVKPFSILVEANLHPFLSQAFKFQGFYTPEEIGTSAHYTFKQNKNFSLESTAIFSFFNINPNTNSSWYFNSEKNFYFHKDLLFRSNLQFEIKSRYLKNTAIFSLYESPFGKFNFCFRNENAFNFNKFSACISDFINLSEYYTSSTNYITPQLQFKIGIKYSTLSLINRNEELLSLFLKTGLNFYISNDLENNWILKFANGNTLNIKNFTGTLVEALSLQKKENKTLELTSISAKFSEKIYFCSCSQNFTFTPSQNYSSWITSQKLSIKINLPQIQGLSINSNLSFSQKNGIQTKQDMDIKLDYNFNFKKIYIKCSVSGSLTL